MTQATKFIGAVALVLPLLSQADTSLVRDDINTTAAYAMQCWAELVVLRSPDLYCEEFMVMERMDVVPLDEDEITNELNRLDTYERKQMEDALSNYNYALTLVADVQRAIKCELDPFGAVFPYW
jgi:hypothetical protein